MGGGGHWPSFDDKNYVYTCILYYTLTQIFWTKSQNARYGIYQLHIVSRDGLSLKCGVGQTQLYFTSMLLHAIVIVLTCLDNKEVTGMTLVLAGVKIWKTGDR